MVMGICRPQGGDVGVSPLRASLQIMACLPIDAWMTKMLRQIKIGGNAGMPPVAIGKQVDLYQPMMETGARF